MRRWGVPRVCIFCKLSYQSEIRNLRVNQTTKLSNESVWENCCFFGFCSIERTGCRISQEKSGAKDCRISYHRRHFSRSLLPNLSKRHDKPHLWLVVGGGEVGESSEVEMKRSEGKPTRAQKDIHFSITCHQQQTHTHGHRQDNHSYTCKLLV